MVRRRRTPKPVAEQETGAEASVQAFRDAIEKSVMISRERLQEVVDDAVRRGRMTRGDAEELVGRVVSRGREQADELLLRLRDLERMVRSELGTRAADARALRGSVAERGRRRATDAAARVRREMGETAATAAKRARNAADQPLARADRLRRRTRLGSFPITAYDQLSVRQVTSRLSELTRDELRKVRDYERRNRDRKSILQAVERRLAK